MPLKVVEGTQILQLSGSPEAMGREHGELLRDQVQTVIYKYLHRSQRTFAVPYSYLREQCLYCLPFIPERYVTEMKALAAASDTEFEDILTLNCLVDVDGCYTQNIVHCCNFVATPPATRDGLFLHGRNLDFPPGNILPKIGVIIARTPDGCTPNISVTWAGFIGTLTGCNAAGLSCGEISTPTPDASVEGIPITFLLRNMIEQSSGITEAIEYLREAPRTCGYNIALCDSHQEEVRGVEFTRNAFGVRSPRDGLLVVDDVCLCRETGTDRLTYPAGAFRHARMTDLLHRSRGAIDAPLALSFLGDQYDAAWGDEDGKGYNCICNLHTIQSVLFNPRERTLLAALGAPPAPKRHYVTLSLDTVWPSPATVAGDEEAYAHRPPKQMMEHDRV